MEALGPNAAFALATIALGALIVVLLALALDPVREKYPWER